jgi:hypothetical protein
MFEICWRRAIVLSSPAMEVRFISPRPSDRSKAVFPSRSNAKRPKQRRDYAIFCLGESQPISNGCCPTFGPLSGRVAQLAEHSTLNRQVGGSIPPASTTSAGALRKRNSSPDVYPLDLQETTWWFGHSAHFFRGRWCKASACFVSPSGSPITTPISAFVAEVKFQPKGAG